MIHLILLFPLYIPLALALGYLIGIQYNRYWILYPLIIVAIPTLFLDVLANYTILSIYMWEKPNKFSFYLGRIEYTFSDRLERLVLSSGWRCNIARFIAKWMNKVAPIKHINNMI